MVRRSNKYQAKYVYWNTEKQVVIHPIDVEIYRCHGKLKLPKQVVRFDSQHEFRVYLELIRMYGVKGVKRQVKVNVFKKTVCYPNSKQWKVDFAIDHCLQDSRPSLYIEAKGFLTTDFINTLALLEVFNEDAWNSLFIVFPDKIPTHNKTIDSLLKNGWKDCILTLKQFKQLINLT